MKIRILYPEVKEVTAEQIIGWYQDAVENGEVTGTLNDERIDVETAALALEDAGLITLVAGQFPIVDTCLCGAPMRNGVCSVDGCVSSKGEK